MNPIDFVRRYYDDENRLNVPAAYKDEERHALIGRIGSRHWTAVFTY